MTSAAASTEAKRPLDPTVTVPPTPAPVKPEALLEKLKPVRAITGWVGTSVEFVRNISGANGELEGASKKAVAVFVRFLIVVSIASTGGLILIPLVFHVIEWKNQAKHNRALANWITVNNVGTIRLNEVLAAQAQKAALDTDAKLKKAAAAAQAKLDPIEKELNKLKGAKVAQLFTQIQLLQGDIEKLKGTNAALENIRATDATNAGALKAQLDKSNDDVQGLTTNAKVDATKLADLTAKLAKAEGELKNLTETAKKEADGLKKDIEVLNAQKVVADAQLAKLTAEGAEGAKAAEQVKKLTADVADLDTRLKNATAQLEKADKAAKENGGLNADLQKQVDKLTADKAAAELEVTQLKAITAKGSDAAKEAAELTQQVKMLNAGLKEKTDELEDANAKIKIANASYADLQKIKATLEETHKKQLQNWTDHNAKLKAQVETNENLVKGLENEVKEAQGKENAAIAKVTELTQKVADGQQALSEMMQENAKKLTDHENALQAAIKEKDNALETAQAAGRTAAETSANLAKAKATLTQRATQHKQAVEKLNGEIKAAAEAKDKAESLLKDAQAQLGRVEGESQKNAARIEELEKQVKAKSEELAQLQATFTLAQVGAQQTMDASTANAEALQKELTTAKQQAADANEKAANAELTIRRLTTEKTAVETLNVQLNEQAAELTRQLEVAQAAAPADLE